jgi:hypothetical protein
VPCPTNTITGNPSSNLADFGKILKIIVLNEVKLIEINKPLV